MSFFLTIFDVLKRFINDLINTQLGHRAICLARTASSSLDWVLCFMKGKRLTTDEFINKSIEVHGEKYDYSLVVYVKNKIKVDIICPQHGIFKQVPYSHLKGEGCYLCSIIKRTKPRIKKHRINKPKINKRGRVVACEDDVHITLKSFNVPVMEGYKICPKCLCIYERTSEHFYKNKFNKDGLDYHCKYCEAIERELNREKTREQTRIRRSKDKDHYYQLNRLWIENNKEKHRIIVNNYINNRVQHDIEFKILRKMRGRIRLALKSQGTHKVDRTMNLVGCNTQDLKKHLESLFTEGMSWDNYGQGGWQIDHIRPCASFDLTDEEQQKLCFHYTNLQPMWGVDNMKKGSIYNGGRVRKNKS